MKTLLSILIFCLLVNVYVSGQNVAQEKLNSAIYLEEVNGELEKAIETYQTIVKDFPNERKIAAKAQFHIGLCYEKKGLQKTRDEYQKVLDNFPEETEYVSLARKKLSTLALTKAVVNEGKSVIAQKIYTNPGFYGNISPDGNYISYVDWGRGNMAVQNLETGDKRLITNEGTWEPPTKFGDMSVWSPDGKFLAYFWFSGKSEQLRIQNLTTGEDRILAQSTEGKCPWPMEWSNDGKYILTLVGLDNSGNNGAIQLVSVKDGSVKTIKTFGDQCPCGGASLSPDGKYVVVSFGNEEKNRDIIIFSVDGSFDNELITFPGADWAPKWTPDGKKIIFASHRSGTPALWSLEVKNGQKVGEPEPIYESISDTYSSMRFTNEGKFIFSTESNYASVFQATLKSDENIFENLTPLATEEPGFYTNPIWSPDGSKLAYLVRENKIPNNNDFIIVRDIKTGKEKELLLGLRNLEKPGGWAGPQWSNDGENLLLHWDAKEYKKLVIVNIETEEKKYLKGFHWKVFGPENSILYISSLQNKIIQQNISTGKEKTLYESKKQIYLLTISKDETKLAFFEGETSKTGWLKELYSMPINNPESKLLWKVNEEQNFTWGTRLNFFPDGETLLLSVTTNNKDKNKSKSLQFYTFNINTLEKKALGKMLKNYDYFIRDVRLSPDGKKIAFSKGSKTSNIWSLKFDFK